MQLAALAAGLVLALGAVPGLAAGKGPLAAEPPVTPAVVQQALAPGGSLQVAKTVRTPVVPPQPDIVLLVDETGSMSSAIDDIKANVPAVVDQVRKEQPDARFAVTGFGDVTDGDQAFTVLQGLTADKNAVVAKADELDATLGFKSNGPSEDWINALWQIANGAGGRITFRPQASPIVVLVSDASSHDPSEGHTLADAQNALLGAGIRLVAVDVTSNETDHRGDGLNGNGDNGNGPGENQDPTHEYGEATTLVDATDGKLLEGIDADDVAQAVVDGLRNLPTTVSYQTVGCDPSLQVDLDPPSVPVTSGDTAAFRETVRVAADAAQGRQATCVVQFLLNGKVPSGDSTGETSGGTGSGAPPGGTAGAGQLPTAANPYQEVIGIAVRDVTAPVVSVDSRDVAADGPKGAKVDYTATAKDAVDGTLPVHCTPAPGSLFPLGTTEVTCTATDSAGNTGTATAEFTVLPAPVPNEADLAVHVVVAPAPTYTGLRTNASITVTNAGPRTATHLVVSTRWPSGKGTVSALPRCTAARPCTLAPGQRLTVVQPAVYHAALDGAVRAKVQGSLPDSHPGDNTATAHLRVLQPRLTLSPTVLRPGDVALVRGTDFPPGVSVPLSWDFGITAASTPVRAAADGTVEAQVLIVPKDVLGPRRLNARPAGCDPLSTPVLVVQGSVQPPDFATRD